MRTDFIAEQLPFSEDEFYRAFRLLESDTEAREDAAFIVQVVREANEQAEAARLAFAADSEGKGRSAGLPTWVIEDGAFALLALVSEDLRLRVEAYMRAQWEGLREQWIRNALYRPGGGILGEPTPEVYAELEAKSAQAEADWRDQVKKTRADVVSRSE